MDILLLSLLLRGSPSVISCLHVDVSTSLWGFLELPFFPQVPASLVHFLHQPYGQSFPGGALVPVIGKGLETQVWSPESASPSPEPLLGVLVHGSPIPGAALSSKLFTKETYIASGSHPQIAGAS